LRGIHDRIAFRSKLHDHADRDRAALETFH
jgi:hypothetical protein